MGLDSVEIVMAWEEAFGITITDAAAAGIVTTKDAVDYIYSQVNTSESSSCASRRAFFELRAALVRRLGVPRRAVRPSTAVKTLVPPDGAAAWKELRGELGLPAWVTLPKRGRGPTAGEMARTMVGCKPRRFGPPNGRWSRHEVREVVRAIVVEETGVPSDYSDDARLVRDLGIN